MAHTLDSTSAESTRPVWLTPQDLVDDIPGLTVGRLAQWRKDGVGPLFHKFGRTVLYDEKDVNEWVAGTLRRSTTDVGRRAR